MLDSFYIAATGMQAQQSQLDTVANNLANMNTQGFKRGRVAFTDLVSRELDPRRVAADAGANVLGSVQRLGAGVGIAAQQKLFEIGNLNKTDSALDIAIAGDGFIEVEMPDGAKAFTRGGTLRVNKDGQLATLSGYALVPGISVPDNVQALIIAADGRVQAQVAGQSTPVELGQLELGRFQNPNGLAAIGDNLYRATDASGALINGRAGEGGIGAVQQGFLEASNVKLVDEMVGLMLAQRAYEASLKVAQASDEMLGMVNNLRK